MPADPPSWQEGTGYWRLADAFASVTGEAEEVARQAEDLFDDTGWLDALLTPSIAGLTADLWFEPPVRTNRDGLRCGAILFESPMVVVSVSILSAARLRALPVPPTILFSGRLAITKYLRGGSAALRRWRIVPLPEPCVAAAMGEARPLPDQTLTDGAIVRLDGRTESHVVTNAARDVVTLSATIQVGTDPVAREYDATTGAFLRMATNDEGAARAQVLLSLLRASGTAASASFDAATHDRAHFLRWLAMREWLAHDWRSAWPRLETVATDDSHPEVRRPRR